MGILRLSLHAAPGASDADAREPLPGLSHAAVFVKGSYYEEMTDNDLRGYLDGRFKFARNQASQIHLRIGRRDRSPFAGEWELFRILQQWENIRLPFASRVTAARLEIDIERGAKRELDLFWWNESRRGSQTWGMPGAGFAGVRHQVMGEYIGDHEWTVEYVPREIGRWHYKWRQQFIKLPMKARWAFLT